MLPFSDWRIEPEEIEIDCRPDGTLWRLGGGGFGDVRAPLRAPVRRRAWPPRPPRAPAVHGVCSTPAAQTRARSRHGASYVTPGIIPHPTLAQLGAVRRRCTRRRAAA